ncbi:MAG: hypothetical protein JXA54_00720 [Candidatus Heimdallarchaeota archaeon]|nr:hypothetical protein [Candidatus Heimdallarchaeota archaeon]
MKAKKGYDRITYVLTIIILLAGVMFTDCTVISQPNIEKDDTFSWEVKYYSNFTPLKATRAKCQIEVNLVGVDYVFYKYSANYLHENIYFDYLNIKGRSYYKENITTTGLMYPNMTLRNFPLGTISPITNIPELHMIVPSLCFISIDWHENIQLFINSTYSNYQEYEIENPAESTFIYNNLYYLKGAYREVCVFVHDFYNSTLETFKIQNMGVVGKMEATYLKNSGILAGYELHVRTSDLLHTLDISIKLSESTVGLGLSKWSKLLIPVSIVIVPYMAIGTFGLGAIAFQLKKRKTDKKRESIRKEKEIIQLEKEIKDKQKNLPVDYYFIETCPFCMKEYPTSKIRCPYCKGKK